MKTPEDSRDVFGEHRLIGDSALLLLVVGAAFFVQPAYWGLQPPHLNSLVTMISALIVIIPLRWRRYFVMTAIIFVTLTLVVPDVFNIISRVNLSSIASTLAIFSKAAYGGRRRNLICFVSIVAFNGGLLYKLIISGNTGFLSSTTLFNITALFWNLLTFSAIWWFGNTIRASRERTSLLNPSTEQLIRWNRKKVRWAVFYEIGRITQKLCGILAHNLRVIATYACAAQQVLTRYFRKSIKSLKRIKYSTWYGVVEVYRVLCSLRDEKQFESYPVQSGIQQLDKLATDVWTSGLQVKVKVEGEKRDVP
jgi:hypothetical protein